MALILELPHGLESELLAQWQQAGLIESSAPFRMDQPRDPQNMSGLEQLRLPNGLQMRLHDLLDRQDRGDKLTADERLEAEGLVELSEFLSLLQIGQAATFHIDHIIPVAAGGTTTAENLALACVSCSLRKSARQTAVDPQTGESVPIYHPQIHLWREHFRWEDVRIAGLTPTGRATVAALQMNRPVVLAIRAEEKFFNRHPPPTVETE